MSGNYSFTFDAKRPSSQAVVEPSTAHAFVKKLDPNQGYSTYYYDSLEMTEIEDNVWSSHNIDFALDETIDPGKILQIGFVNYSTNYGPTGVYYDNIEITTDNIPPEPKEPTSDDSCPGNVPQSHDGYQLIWSDTFDDSSLNLNNWQYMYGDGSAYGIPGWGNNEIQLYGDSDANTYLANGCLFIVPRYDASTNTFFSSRLRSFEKQEFQFGRIDVSFSVPEINGVWPAIWMMPEESIYGGWPASGEIDLVETKDTTSQILYTTIHYGIENYRTAGRVTNFPFLNKLSNVEEHNIISLIWDEDSFSWLVNNNEVYTVNFSALEGLDPNPFLESFHMLLNVAVGGHFPAQLPVGEEFCNYDDECLDSKKLIIDYVAYYSKDT